MKFLEGNSSRLELNRNENYENNPKKEKLGFSYLHKISPLSLSLSPPLILQNEIELRIRKKALLKYKSEDSRN